MDSWINGLVGQRLGPLISVAPELRRGNQSEEYHIEKWIGGLLDKWIVGFVDFWGGLVDELIGWHQKIGISA